MEQPTQTYESWKACMTAGGDVRTKEAVRGRVAILSDPEHPETKRFTESYGTDRLRQVLGWFSRLEKEI
jgi:hypothetical protein